MSVGLVVFYATPHYGSDLASENTYTKWLLGSVLGKTEVVKQLAAENNFTQFDKLNTFFTGYSCRHITKFSFGENEKMGSDMVQVPSLV